MNQLANGVQIPQTKSKSVEQEVVYSTSDYDIFKGVVGNRPISRGHVNRLARSIEKRNLLSKNPITVTKDMRIIDGQHRLEAARMKKVRIYYMIAEGAGLTDIQLLNSTMKPWTGYDYMNSYAELGFEQYIVIKEFVEKYGIIISNSLTILSGFKGGRTWTDFKDGKFKIKNLEQAEKFVISYLKLKPLVSMRIWNDREFVSALFQMTQEIGVDEFLERFEEYARPIEYQATTKDYLRTFETILNWGQRKSFTRLF